MVPEDYVTEAMRKEATLVVDSLDQFKPELFGLPPFDKWTIHQIPTKNWEIISSKPTKINNKIS